MSLSQRTHGSLTTNPPAGNVYHLTEHGSDWLWAVDACYILILLITIGWTYFARSGEKIFHYLMIISLFVGSIAYYACASDLGWTPVEVVDRLSHSGTRQIFYARYIN